MRDVWKMKVAGVSYIGFVYGMSIILSKESNFNQDAQAGFAIFALICFPFFVVGVSALFDFIEKNIKEK